MDPGGKGEDHGIAGPELIDRFVEHREATAEGEEERVKELAAEIDNLLREKEDREVGDLGICSGPPPTRLTVLIDTQPPR